MMFAILLLALALIAVYWTTAQKPAPQLRPVRIEARKPQKPGLPRR